MFKKNVCILFKQRDNLQLPLEFSIALNQLESKILKWKKTKIKTNNYNTAKNMAEEFDKKFKSFFSEFCLSVNNATNNLKQSIDVQFNQWYKNAKVDMDYDFEEAFSISDYKYSLPMLKEEFLCLRKERYVDPKEGFFDFLKNSVNNDVKDLVLEITFSYEEWRQYAFEKYLEVATNVINDKAEKLLSYYDELSEYYQKHIDQLIIDTTNEKNCVAERLSEKERLLQLDYDWLEELKDQLYSIERG